MKNLCKSLPQVPSIIPLPFFATVIFCFYVIYYLVGNLLN